MNKPKRIVSRLGFIEGDIEAIERINIEAKEVSGMIKDIKDKVDELKKKLLEEIRKEEK